MNSNNCHPAFLNLDCLADESPVEESQTLESRMVPMRKPGPARALAPAEIDWSQVEVLHARPENVGGNPQRNGV